MARLFHALVVAGATVSASACAGKSTSSDGDEAGAGGTGGTTGGDAGSSNGGTATGGTATGGSSHTGGVPATGGVPPTGGAAPNGGTAGVAGLPDPGSRAQWNCSLVETDRTCVDVLGTTASPIPDSCPVEPERPRSAADCAAGELFTCILAVTPSSELTLVNCSCEAGTSSCIACTNLHHLHGEPAYCDGVRKVCACAYTGILR